MPLITITMEIRDKLFIRLNKKPTMREIIRNTRMLIKHDFFIYVYTKLREYV